MAAASTSCNAASVPGGHDAYSGVRQLLASRHSFTRAETGAAPPDLAVGLLEATCPPRSARSPAGPDPGVRRRPGDAPFTRALRADTQPRDASAGGVDGRGLTPRGVARVRAGPNQGRVSPDGFGPQSRVRIPREHGTSPRRVTR